VIDEIWLSPNVHVISGAVVVLSTLAALVMSAMFAWRERDLSPAAHATLVVAQVALMVQALVGIKLLDQGLGSLQLFIHYVGGLGPLLFFFVYYWLPSSWRRKRWTSVTVTGAAFLFAIMAFGIGASYVPGGI